MCKSKDFKKSSLKLVHTQTFANLFGVSSLQKYEASDITGAYSEGDGLYTVFDNSYMVARNTRTLGNISAVVRSKPDDLLRWEGTHGQQSGFEFIAYNRTGANYIIGQEAVKMKDGSFRSRTIDVTFHDGFVKPTQECVTDFSFSHENKGFEGAIVVRGTTGRSFLVALCEGNHCAGGKRGRKRGHGRLVVMERYYSTQNRCEYRTVNVHKLPKNAHFEDYSAMALWNSSTLAIVSQADAAVFVAQLLVYNDSLHVTHGTVYDMPRNDDCEIEFCNVEGVHFVHEKLLVCVSDSMKSEGRQNHRCRRRDESIHVMAIPS